MTALALLTYLAHGETPASPEFGKTVDKGIRWLLQRQGADGRYECTGGNDLGYTHVICAYALAEAYAMTKLPTVKEAAQKAMDVIVRGQNASGGWNYKCLGERTDVSVTAWAIQALKAAKMAGLGNSGIEEAMKKTVGCMKKVLFDSATGKFNYQNGGDAVAGSLTGAGVLTMQFLGAATEPETKRALDWLAQNASANWETPWGRSPFYDWYYVTQAKFHTGGETWKAWNKQFSVALVKNQTTLKGAGIDGKDIGYWKPVTPQEYCQNYVYNTTLCALMLQVYYRYLPTFQKPEEMAADAKTAAKGEKDDGKEPKAVAAQDLPIQITM
jgi:hypothetical protein